MPNPKKCTHCGRFLNKNLHGACLKCIRSGKELPPLLNALKVEYERGKFIGKHKASVRGIINAASTLAYDGDWFAVKWNPLANLQKVVDTRDDRPYLTDGLVEEINGLIEEAENMKGE